MKKIILIAVIFLNISTVLANPLDVELRTAVREERVWRSLRLLIKGAKADVPDAQGITALQLAIAKKMHPVVELMLVMTKKLDDADARGWTPLFYSIQNASLFEAVELLRYGSDPNKPENITGLSPLSYALQISSKPMIKALLDHGGSMMGEDKMGNTSLMYAMDRSDVEILSMLYKERGSEFLTLVHRTNKNGENALTFAAQAQNLEGAAYLWLLGAHQESWDVHDKRSTSYFSEENYKIWDCIQGTLGINAYVHSNRKRARLAKWIVQDCRERKIESKNL